MCTRPFKLRPRRSDLCPRHVTESRRLEVDRNRIFFQFRPKPKLGPPTCTETESERPNSAETETEAIGVTNTNVCKNTKAYRSKTAKNTDKICYYVTKMKSKQHIEQHSHTYCSRWLPVLTSKIHQYANPNKRMLYGSFLRIRYSAFSQRRLLRLSARPAEFNSCSLATD